MNKHQRAYKRYARLWIKTSECLAAGPLTKSKNRRLNELERQRMQAEMLVAEPYRYW